MLFKILVSFFLIFYIKISSAEILTCEYETSSWNFAEPVYICAVDSFEIFNRDRVSIDGANGEHFAGHSDDNVQGFGIFRAYNLHYFPRNIDKVFKNVIWIAVHKSNLQEIHQNDLKVFPDLKYLYLDNNEIEVLEADLFKFNTKLKLLWIDNNPYKHIDSNVFSHLENLKTLRIGKCKKGIYFDHADTETDAFMLVRKIEEGKCVDETYSTTTTTEIITMAPETTTKITNEENDDENISIFNILLILFIVILSIILIFVLKEMFF
ncbi:hypothetical protein PVAND_015852 [Polypedilum vanderplanki]|uniref:Uncharacterized protein n=1 Tax=Polypedilum vanderplanki TaxID=319348 RepID=A0A9J6BEC9_POLVA|nr:hypothetical protein PVAND_015852 [Polypedilum vanderplanki]